MKHYDHETKKWLTDEELEIVKAKRLKKAKTCRSGKPHNFILVLPSYITSSKTLSPEEIERYYVVEEKLTARNEEIAKEFLEIGIISRRYMGKVYRSYRCDICGKKDTK